MNEMRAEHSFAQWVKRPIDGVREMAEGSDRNQSRGEPEQKQSQDTQRYVPLLSGLCRGKEARVGLSQKGPFLIQTELIAESSIALFVQGDSPCHICQGQFLFASISNLISCC